MDDVSLASTRPPTTKHQVLVSLKRDGPLTADDLAASFGISAVAVRRHLANLERDHLVRHTQERQAKGRPSFRYELTEEGHKLFPRRYDQLANQILETVDELYGAEAIDRIFHRNLSRQIETYRPHLTGKTLRERVNQLTQLREADGYMASWEQLDDGSFLLRQNNCPILSVAQWCRATCAEATSMFGELLDAAVSRQSHQIDGDASCTFLVRER